MKKIITTVLIATTILFLFGCNKDEDNQTQEELTISLTKVEKTDLLHLVEEEKLARDVYLYAYEKYGLNISKNISNSEEIHMNAVVKILNTYGIKNSYNSTIGVFNNQELQKLYNELTAKVDISLLEALKVGAIIEDLDINDIVAFTKKTNKQDILTMYSRLLCGSRNHLRAYHSQIILNGGNYSPTYISKTEFKAIINSSNEKCGQQK